MEIASTLPYDYVNALLAYDAVSGSIKWIGNRKGHSCAGKEAGFVAANGYRVIRTKNRNYPSQYIAWLLHYGIWPTKILDHINGNRGDNSIGNLREVTQRENSQNLKKHRDGHLVGTTFNKVEGAWRSQIIFGKKKVYIGKYATQEEAHEAYMKMTPEDAERILQEREQVRETRGLPDKIHWNTRRSKYIVMHTINGKKKYFGGFDTLEKAISVNNQVLSGELS